MTRKKVLSIMVMAVLMLVVMVTLGVSNTDLHAAATPYTTFTTDNQHGFIKTSDAYTPNGQISSVNGEAFKTLEYVFVDKEDYIYISDSGNAEVYIFDANYNYVTTLSYNGDGENIPAFYAVNSIFVSDDKIYIPDSFRKAIYIFDRDSVLHRETDFYLWLEDVDTNNLVSDGDLVYLADATTGNPIGSAVYRIALNGTSTEGNLIVQFISIDTNEVIYEKIALEEMSTPNIEYLANYDYNGTEVKKITIFAPALEPIQVVMTPSNPIFQLDEAADESEADVYTFAPRRVVADTRGNMYIVGARSDNGLIMLNYDGEFVTFFGGNAIRTPLVDQIRSFLLTDAQEKKLLAASGISIDYISGVAIDEKGFIYTVTSTLEDNNIKKFNVSGTNYLEGDISGWVGAVDIKIGAYNNIIAVDEYGWIYEYDSNGQLIFAFSVKESGNSRAGLLKLPKSIAVDTNDNLYVVDQGARLVQIYKPTAFTNSIHTAIQAYQDGDEELAQINWQYALQYATVFDLAHIGLGDAYVREEEFEKALTEYTLSTDQQGISDTYWQVRQYWLEDNLNIVFLSIIGLVFLVSVWKIFNKRKHYSDKMKKFVEKLRTKSKTLDELLYIGYFIKHPIDAFYEIKRHNRVSVKTATIIYLLLGLVYIFYQTSTNIIFLDTFNPNILYQLIILASVLFLWVIANYFVCLIADGEGSFKNVYVATAMTFTPFLFIAPIVTIYSNVLTYQETIFFSGPLTFTTIWVIIYFFFMIKEIHNYEVGETVKIIFKSAFTMLIMGIFIFVVYSLNNQFFTVVSEIIKELIER